MKKYQNTLLAGVAAFALVAGTGLASAQESKEPLGGSQPPQAGQSMNKGSQPQAQEKGKANPTQAQEKGKANPTEAQEKGKANPTQALEKGKTNSNRTVQSGKENMNPSAQEPEKMGKRGARAERKNGGQNTAEQQRTLKGLRGDTTKPMQGEKEGSTSNTKGNTSNQAQQQTPQNNQNMQRGTGGTENTQRGTESNQGNARVNGGGTEVQGGSVQLSEQQRTQIKTTVINGRNAPRVSHVDFDVRVGIVIPRSKIHVVPVPETLVRIEPRWRGFLYFVYEDELVIVNPRDMKIVAVIPV